MEDFQAISEKVIYVNLCLENLTTIRIIQAYAPISSYDDEKVTQFCDTHTLVMGKFNCKIGMKQRNDKKFIGTPGLGIKRQKGSTMMNFSMQQELFNINEATSII